MTFSKILQPLLFAVVAGFMGFFAVFILVLSTGKAGSIGAGAAGLFQGVPLGSIIGLILYRFITYGINTVNLWGTVLGSVLALIVYRTGRFITFESDYAKYLFDDYPNSAVYFAIFCLLILPALSLLSGYWIIDYYHSSRKK